MDDNEFRNNFEIDHCRPLATFDFSDQEQQYDAFSWTNTQPLLKIKNRSKGAKRNVWSEVLQEMKVVVFLKQYYPEFCSSNVEEA